MDTSSLDLEGIALVSKITGQRADRPKSPPLMLFLAALITILVGVIAMDGVITEAEKHHLQTRLHALIPPEHPVYPQLQPMIQRVEEQQTYLDPQHLQPLVAPLSESERLLLLGLGYEMAAIDGEVDFRENMYLQAIAQRLNIAPQHQLVLESGFIHRRFIKLNALSEVRVLLNPNLFVDLDIACVNFARTILAMLDSISGS